MNTRFAKKCEYRFTIADRSIAGVSVSRYARRSVGIFRHCGINGFVPECFARVAVDTHQVPFEIFDFALIVTHSMAGIAGHKNLISDHNRAGNPSTRKLQFPLQVFVFAKLCRSIAFSDSRAIGASKSKPICICRSSKKAQTEAAVAKSTNHHKRPCGTKRGERMPF